MHLKASRNRQRVLTLAPKETLILGDEASVPAGEGISRSFYDSIASVFDDLPVSRYGGPSPPVSSWHLGGSWGVLFAALNCGAQIIWYNPNPSYSTARNWDERALETIRADTPNPPVQAGIYSVTLSVCYDAWAVYRPNAVGFIYHGKFAAADVTAARNEAISYAVYRMMAERLVYSRTAVDGVKSHRSGLYDGINSYGKVVHRPRSRRCLAGKLSHRPALSAGKEAQRVENRAMAVQRKPVEAVFE